MHGMAVVIFGMLLSPALHIIRTRVCVWTQDVRAYLWHAVHATQMCVLYGRMASGRHQDRTHNSARTSCNQNIFVCRHANEPVTRAILSPTASFIFDSLRTLSYEKPHRHTIGKPPMLFLQFVLRATRTPHKSCDTHSHMSISVCVCVLYVF